MQKGNIIMMYGYICSLKTELSSALADKMGIGRLESKQLGKIAEDFGKEGRSALLVKLVAECASAGRDVIIDATFGKKEYRQPVYDFAEQQDIGDIVVINCYCDDKKEVWRRIHERKESDDLCIKEWLEKSYHTLQDDLYKGDLPSIIKVDTKEYMVDIANSRSKFCSHVADNLKEILSLKKECKKSTEDVMDILSQFALNVAYESAKPGGLESRYNRISKEARRIAKKLAEFYS